MAGAGVALAEDALGGTVNLPNLVRLKNRLDFGLALFMPNRGSRANTMAGIPAGGEPIPSRPLR
uniref:Uncharacterized protein n=1 Tax=Candidatus Kentrum sp. SD TaxID=2126332 RepID=A0A450YKT3_9GAMM|nr:MAG: hypothetical protein BECKSD772F_GA0070984_111510 [Candidatus Kentron sp. SD]VFK47702.1 MAG: hypothetical protein BECKSD772E_GA0070983_110310 [Candidatus Kentron sp. SD]